MQLDLNARAGRIVTELISRADELRVQVVDVPDGGRVIDCGIKVAGSLGAGIELARTCMAGLGAITIVPGDVGGIGWPLVQVTTDHPTAACLYSQYAG